MAVHEDGGFSSGVPDRHRDAADVATVFDVEAGAGGGAAGQRGAGCEDEDADHSFRPGGFRISLARAFVSNPD